MVRLWRAHTAKAGQDGAGRGGSRSTAGGRAIRLAYTPVEGRRSCRNTPSSGSMRLTKDRDTYITTEVGQHQMWAAQFYQLRGAEPLDDLGRAGHDGLRPAGGARRADRPSRRAGHRHRRRCLGADDHAGDVDGGPVRGADQDLHPQQPVYGHGAAVAAACCTATGCRIPTPKRCPISSSWPKPMAASASAATSRAISTTRSRR